MERIPEFSVFSLYQNLGINVDDLTGVFAKQ
jgi:hypothetical protein